jgi:ParB/RepB/Spo0J family partition protein
VPKAQALFLCLKSEQEVKRNLNSEEKTNITADGIEQSAPDTPAEPSAPGAENPAPDIPENGEAAPAHDGGEQPPGPGDALDGATHNEGAEHEAGQENAEPPAPADPAAEVNAPDKEKDGGKEDKAPGDDKSAPAAEDKPPEPGKATSAAEEQKKKRGRQPKPGKDDKAAPTAEDKPPEQGKAAPEAEEQKKGRGKPSTIDKAEKSAEAAKEETSPAPAEPEPPPPPPPPREAPRPNAPEQIVYLKLDELHAFKNHPFGVRDDDEMKALVESVREKGVNQPAIVRPREDGGYELIAGHRRQMASRMAGILDMPCIVRKMTDDEAVLAMTDDNLRQRSSLLPSEKAISLKMQIDAISHQGARTSGQVGQNKEEAGQRSVDIVAARNGTSAKQVQRYVKLTELVPDLMKAVDEKKIGFTTAVELAFIKRRNQNYISVAMAAEENVPSMAQAKRMRDMDKNGELNGDVIDGILSEQKKEEIRVIISGKELEPYFSKDKTPQEMKEQIMKLLDDWQSKDKTRAVPNKKPPER